MNDRGCVHVVDDEESFRTALARFLGAAGYDVRTYASAEEFLGADSGVTRGCLILDVGLTGRSGLELQNTLEALERALPIVFVSGQSDIPQTVQALRAGALDFLTKPVQHQALLAAVESALARGASWWAERQEEAALRARYDTLTPREREVLSHVATGRLNKQIAADIGVAERTVKAHRAQVMDKMQASSVADLVRAYDRLEAKEAGMAEPGPRVVIVDDDTSMREAVERLLHVADFEPLPFASAEAFLACPAAASAACFVLDIRLPGLSGFALHARLRADGCDAPILFITAHDDGAARQRAVGSDAADYLAKPFLGSVLLEAIHRALESRGGTHWTRS